MNPLQEIKHRDIFIRLFVRCYEHNPGLTILGIYIIFNAPSYILGYTEGVFVNPNLQPDMWRDIGFYGWQLSIVLLSIFLGKFYTVFPATINALNKNGVLVFSESQSYKTFCKKIENILNAKWSLICVYAASILFTLIIIVLFHFADKDTWHDNPQSGGPSLASIFYYPATLLLVYIIAKTTACVIHACLIIHFLLKEDIRIKLLHPDRCGGLAPIGSLSILFNLLVFSIGLILAISFLNTIFVWDIPYALELNIFCLFAYLALAAYAVFTPIASAHSQMKEAKHKMILEISNAFDLVQTELSKKLLRIMDDTPPHLSDYTGKIAELKKLYEIASRQPIWPFNTKVIYSFLASIATPILTFIGSSLTNMLESLFQ